MKLLVRVVVDIFFYLRNGGCKLAFADVRIGAARGGNIRVAEQALGLYLADVRCIQDGCVFMAELVRRDVGLPHFSRCGIFLAVLVVLADVDGIAGDPDVLAVICPPPLIACAREGLFPAEDILAGRATAPARREAATGAARHARSLWFSACGQQAG